MNTEGAGHSEEALLSCPNGAEAVRSNLTPTFSFCTCLPISEERPNKNFCLWLLIEKQKLVKIKEEGSVTLTQGFSAQAARRSARGAGPARVPVSRMCGSTATTQS